MKKRVTKTQLLKNWADDTRRPVITLAVKAEISTGLASELIRGKYRNGEAPEDGLIRRKIAKAIGVEECDLFPEVNEDTAA